MTHGWKVMNHTIFLRPKREGLYVFILPRKNFIITVHWNVGRFQTSSYLKTKSLCDSSHSVDQRALKESPNIEFFLITKVTYSSENIFYL